MIFCLDENKEGFRVGSLQILHGRDFQSETALEATEHGSWCLQLERRAYYICDKVCLLAGLDTHKGNSDDDEAQCIEIT